MGGILESSCNDVMLSSSHPLLTSPSSLNVMVLMQLETAADINNINNINTEPPTNGNICSQIVRDDERRSPKKFSVLVLTLKI